MGRTVLTVLGVILAIWLAFSVLGWLLSMLKFFIFVGIIAAIGYVVVTVLSKTSSKNR